MHPDQTALMAAQSRAAVTGGSAGVVALAAWAGDMASTAALVVAAVVFAFGWPRLVDVPSKRGSWIVIALTALAAIGAVWGTRDISALALVVAGGVIGSFVHQMARRDGRPRLTETVSTTVTGILVVTAGVGWLVVALAGSLEVVLLGAATLLAASAATAVPGRGSVVAGAAAVAAGAVGALVGAVLAPVGVVPGLLLGVVVGVVMALTHLLFSQFPFAAHRRGALAAALMPLLTLGAAVLVLRTYLG